MTDPFPGNALFLPLVLMAQVSLSACGEPESAPVSLDVEEWHSELELRIGSTDDPQEGEVLDSFALPIPMGSETPGGDPPLP